MTNHIVVAYSVNCKAGLELSSGASIPDSQWECQIPVPRVRAQLRIQISCINTEFVSPQKLVSDQFNNTAESFRRVVIKETL